MRKSNFDVKAQEADALFDSWDESGDGTLDFDELREAFSKMQEEALAFDAMPVEGNSERDRLLRQADLFDAAAAESAQAAKLEADLEEFSQRLRARNDVRLGELLQRRRITPGEVVNLWASSKGEHTGELSKVGAESATRAKQLSARRFRIVEALFERKGPLVTLPP